MSALSTITPRKYSWHSFLLETEGHSAPGRITSMKNSDDTTGNRTRDLAASSAMPQPSALQIQTQNPKCFNEMVNVKQNVSYNKLFFMRELREIVLVSAEIKIYDLSKT